MEFCIKSTKHLRLIWQAGDLLYRGVEVSVCKRKKYVSYNRKIKNFDIFCHFACHLYVQTEKKLKCKHSPPLTKRFQTYLWTRVRVVDTVQSSGTTFDGLRFLFYSWGEFLKCSAGVYTFFYKQNSLQH